MLQRKCDCFLILLIVEAVCILALLPRCFGNEEMVDGFWGADILELTVQTEDHTEFSGNRVALSPGEYQVKIWTCLEEGQSMFVEMKADSAYFKTLRNNGMIIFSEDDYETFDVFVLDKVPSAYVQCCFYNIDSNALVRLEVWKTNAGGRMLLFIVLTFFAVLDFFVNFRRRILAGQVTGKQQVVFWALAAGVLLSFYPYLTDYFFGGDDTNFHLGRIAYLADTLRQGSSFPVRIEGTWMYGHGYVSPMFYSDFFLYIPAFLRLTGFSIMTSYKIFLFLMTVAAAVIAYHSFKKCVKDEYAALFGSMFYLLVPYRLHDMYTRMAVGEYLAMIFLPLVFCGMYLLYTGDVAAKEYKSYKWYVVWGMSAILQSHLISTEMSAAFMLLCCIIFWKRTFRRQTFVQLSEAAGLVLLVNAWFWLPLLHMLNCDSYQLQTLGNSDVQYSGMLLRNLFFLLPYIEQKYAERNDICIGIGPVMLLLFYLLWRYKRKKKNTVCDVFALFSLLALVMSTKYFPWGMFMKIPGIGNLVASLQFPWRWMSPAVLFMSLLAIFLFRQIMGEGGMIAKAALGILALAVVVSEVYHVNSLIFEAPPYYLYNEENMGTMVMGGGEYLLSESEISELHYHKPIAEDGLTWREYEKAGTTVTISLENTAAEVRYIEIPLTGYKGYGVTASDSGTEVPSISEERGAHGDLRLAVPAGYQGTVRISYEGFALFHVAEAVSLVSLVAIFVFCFYKKRVTV